MRWTEFTVIIYADTKFGVNVLSKVKARPLPDIGRQEIASAFAAVPSSMEGVSRIRNMGSAVLGVKVLLSECIYGDS